ncbi:MAG TPA: hypothetical protein PLP19_21525 [bacterium]|nr:hypothetical protein [bacterium]HPN46079.1 hypothetical protein [bacterium]
MEENRFFKTIWRIDGILLLIVGLLAIIVLAYALFGVIGNSGASRDEQVYDTKQTDSKEAVHWQLGSLIPVEGSSAVMLPLETGDRYSESGYKDYGISAWNFLFIDSRNNKNHWLFDNNRNMILASDLLVEENYSASVNPVRAIVYQLVTADSDGDGELTSYDRQSVGLSQPDGYNYREVVKDIDFVIGHRLVDKDNLLLVYQHGGKTRSALVSLKAFTITNEREIDLAGNGGE